MGSVVHIFVAPGRGESMTPLEQAEALTDCGLAGDRYADARSRRSRDYQVTLIEMENIEAFTRAVGLPLAPHEPRRNLVTRGTRLNGLLGKRFAVGEVELEGLQLCEPCVLFASRTHREVLRFFVKRGGLRARINRGGVIRCGDEIAEDLSAPAQVQPL